MSDTAIRSGTRTINHANGSISVVHIPRDIGVAEITSAAVKLYRSKGVENANAERESNAA